MLKDHIVDRRTGFQTPGPGFVGVGLNSDQKVSVLKEYSETFNLSKAAKSAVTTRSLVTLHLKEDKAFREAFENVTNELLDDVEESLYKQSKKSPIAAMQFLKAKRSKEWGNHKKTEDPVDKTSDKLKALLENENG